MYRGEVFRIGQLAGSSSVEETNELFKELICAWLWRTIGSGWSRVDLGIVVPSHSGTTIPRSTTS
jgi:hypothetical protein